MMSLPDWSEVREALTAAIRGALPLQVRKTGGERIAGVGLHFDAYYGSAGLYLLPEGTAKTLGPDELDSIGDWPISTDWDGREDHARAFAAHWDRWDAWFRNHLDGITEPELNEKWRGLHRVACEAMRAVELSEVFESFQKTDRFKVIICEHDDPDKLAGERYGAFVRSGIAPSDGNDA